MTLPAGPPRNVSRTRLVIANPSFRRLWAIGSASSTMRWLETVALGVFVFNLTDSPFAVALTFFFRMIPMLLFGAFIGAFADRVSRKHVLAVAFTVLASTYAVLGLAALMDVIDVWHVYAGAVVAGLVWATDFPVRRAMIGDVLPREQVGTGLGLDMATSNFARVPGPLLAGIFLTTIGVEAVYFLGSVLFFTAAAVAISMDSPSPEYSGERVSPMRNIIEGLRYVRKDSLIVTVLAVTVIMNMFAFPYQAMAPVIARDTLHVNALLLGVLVSVEGLGATLGALWVALKSNQSHYTRVYFWGSVLFLVVILGFSRVPWYGLALPLMFVGGFGMAAFGTMQSIIIISATPSRIRGRVLGVLAVTIGTGPLAALYVGAIAQALGAQIAVMMIAIGGIALMALVAVLSPSFLRLRSVEPLGERNGAVTGSVDSASTTVLNR